MTTRPALLVLALVLACGGDPGGSSASQSGSSSTATTGTPDATTGNNPTTGATTTSATTGGASDSQGQTTGATTTSTGTASATGSTSVAETTTGETTSSSTTGADSSTGAIDLCADFKQPSCFKSGCDPGFECKQVQGECVPSACTCDPDTGLPGACTPDCSGGTCVPAGDACVCMKDTDCVKTSSGCCPCNAGGDEVPAHKSCIDQVMKCDLPPDQVNCPQVFLCTDLQPACNKGVCVLQ